MTTFSTRDEAINYVIASIEATGVVQDATAEYDIDAIADAVIGDYPDYEIAEDGEGVQEFWAIVEAHAR